MEAFRKFVILSSCYSFIPQEYLRDETVYPERLAEKGLIYVEAEDKVSLKKIGEIQFTRAEDVVGVVYNSKSSSTKLRWIRSVKGVGKLRGEASVRSVLKMVEAKVISEPALQKPRDTAGKPSPKLSSRRKSF